MCRSGSDLLQEWGVCDEYGRRDEADLPTKGSAVGNSFIEEPHLLSFYSKGLKTDKLPAHVFEIDEDAKDEVSGWA